MKFQFSASSLLPPSNSFLPQGVKRFIATGDAPLHIGVVTRSWLAGAKKEKSHETSTRSRRIRASAGPALADGNGGPQAPNNAFLIWQKQGGERAAFSSHEALANQANRTTKVATSAPKTKIN